MYRGAWHGDPNSPQTDPAPKELLPNRHPVPTVAARVAGGFHPGTDSCRPGRGTEPAGPVEPLPGAPGGRREFPAGNDGPCLSIAHRPAPIKLYRGGRVRPPEGQRGVRPQGPWPGDRVRPRFRSKTTTGTPTTRPPPPHPHACPPDQSGHAAPSYARPPPRPRRCPRPAAE